MLNRKEKNTFLSFRIAKETFAVSVERVLEVLEKQNITEVPNVNAYIKGVINFRGKIIPVIDSRSKFNLSERQNGEKYVVIVFELFAENKKMLIGMMVDSVVDVINPEESEMLGVPDLGLKEESEFIYGMLKSKKSYTMILDIDKVFTKDGLFQLDNIIKSNEIIDIEDSV